MALIFTPFKSYLEVRRLIPHFLWYPLRLGGLALTGGTLYLLFQNPLLGLQLFWQVFTPLLPIIFFILPGLWRNVCPMATLNQIPRALKISFEFNLNGFWRKWSYLIGVVAFFVIVAARPIYFNNNSLFTIGLIAGGLALSLLGGLLFKGKSGWCGTFCPLAPIQKSYGQAPLLYFRNSFCKTCLGCQKNCYDFNPRPTLITDISDPDQHYNAHKRFFIGALPGFILAYFTAQSLAFSNPTDYVLIFLRNITFSVGLFHIAFTYLPLSLYKISVAFIFAAIGIFYYYILPTLIPNLMEVLELAQQQWVPGTPIVWPASTFQIIEYSQYFIIGVGVLVLIRSIFQELQFKLNLSRLSSVKVHNVDSVRRGLKDHEHGVSITEDSSGQSFPIEEGQSILEAAEQAGIPVESGCRMGLCGADPIAITDCVDNLSPPTPEELETLERIGLLGKARLACSVCVTGSVRINLDPSTKDALPTQKETDVKAGSAALKSSVVPFSPKQDPLKDLHIVILGNGVAGTSFVQHLRAKSKGCKITLVSRENHNFYNRMGVCRLIYGHSSMQGLYLLPETWYSENKIDIWLSTRVSKLDIRKREIGIAMGSTLHYDRLILATGARPIVPSLEGNLLAGVFTLREAEDALDIRNWCQSQNSRNAVIIGGGFQGVEAAVAMSELGIEVTLVNRSHYLCERHLDAESSTILKDHLEGRGVRVALNSTVDKLVGKKSLQAVLLKNGDSLKAEACIINIGVAPNIDLVDATEIKTSKGILVDKSMRSSDPYIYAVGDCAEIASIPFGLWGVSMEMARVAAKNILGENIEIEQEAFSVPYILKVGGIDVRSFGRTLSRDTDRAITRESTADNKWWRVIINNQGVIVGGIFINNGDMATTMRQAMLKNLDVSKALGVSIPNQAETIDA